MLDYVKRSVQRSPSMMREPGDACNFLRQAGRSHKIPNLIPDVSLEALKAGSLKVLFFPTLKSPGFYADGSGMETWLNSQARCIQ